MTIRQFVYCSHATREMDDEQLRDLLRESRRLNSEHDVTGLLLYIQRSFLQCIEGEAGAIEQLASNIRRDERNDRFTVILDRKVPGRAFPGWSMGFKAMSLDALRDEDGFRHLGKATDLTAVDHDDRALFGLMNRIYSANAGREL